MTKKTLKILLGGLIGTLSVGAVCGLIYGTNSSVHNWVDNAINKVTKDVPEEYKDVVVESKLELTAAQLKNQGLQAVENTDPEFSLKFALKNLPSDFNKDSTLVTKIMTGDSANAYFKVGDNKYYDSITHANNSEFKFDHKAFSKTDQNSKYLIKTYWASYPDIYLNTEVTFKSDFTATDAAKMQIVDGMAITTSFAEQQGVQVYSDTAPTALISPVLKNKKSTVSANALIGNKVVYGDAAKITFANALGGSSSTIGMCHSNDILAIQHTKFAQTGKVENYVIRSYLLEDESCYLDTRITFKSDYAANSTKPVAGTLALAREQNGSMSTWEIATNVETFSTTLTFTSSVNKVSYFRLSTDQGNNDAVLTIGAKTYRNGIAEVENNNSIGVSIAGIKAGKTYNYYIDYVCIQDPTVVTRIPVVVKGYVATPAQTNSQNTQSPAQARMAMPRMLALGGTGQSMSTSLTATLLPENATDKNIKWTVSSNKVTLSAATSVSGNPITITAASPFEGYVTVIAKSEVDFNIAATCQVTYVVAD